MPGSSAQPLNNRWDIQPFSAAELGGSDVDDVVVLDRHGDKDNSSRTNRLPTCPSIGINLIVSNKSNINNDHIESEIRIGWRMAGLGMEVSSTFAAGALLGWTYDHFKGTGSNGLLTGAIIGIVVGMWILIQGALKMNRMLDRQHPTLGRGKAIDPDPYEDGSDGEGINDD